MQDAPVFERGKEGEDATLIIPRLVTAFLAGSAVNLLFLARKWTGEKNAQKARPNIYIYLRAGFSTDNDPVFRCLPCSTTHLDAQFRVLRRAVGRVLTLARERRVVVVLARHHPQHGFHGVQRAVVEQFLGRFYASVQHVPKPVDPRDLQSDDD